MTKDRFELFNQMVTGASKTLQRIKIKNMEKYGLTGTHTMFLRLLYENPSGLTKSEMAQNCDVDKAQITRIVNDLVKREYVKTDEPERAYKKRFILTSEGHRVADEINKLVLDINEYVSGGLERNDIEKFYKTFETINRRLRDAEEVF